MFLKISYEKRPGLGEDDCLILRGPWCALAAVFDGLGGSGATLLDTPEGPRSGAYLGSRAARAAVKSCEHLLLGGWPGSGVGAHEAEPYVEDVVSVASDITSAIATAIRQHLEAEAVRTGARRNSPVKGTMIRILPTTMAAAWLDPNREELAAMWAGDSRVYILTPADGLQQITTDDIKTHGDALANLVDDSPMSNCMSAGSDFIIHERSVPLPAQALVFAATDGCFDFLPTPLHFENTLLSTLRSARSWAEWKDSATLAISAVTQDDATLTGVAIGWPDFESMRDSFSMRYSHNAAPVRDYDQRAAEVFSLEKKLGDAKKALAAEREDIWRAYRASYEAYQDAATNDVVAEFPAARRLERVATGPAMPVAGPAVHGDESS